MCWKDWPYWLKGAVIAGVYSIYALIIQYTVLNLPTNTLNSSPIFAIIGILQWPLYGAILLTAIPFIGPEGIKSSYGFLGGVIILVLLGALIGWIVGKIKSK